MSNTKSNNNIMRPSLDSSIKEKERVSQKD